MTFLLRGLSLSLSPSRTGVQSKSYGSRCLVHPRAPSSGHASRSPVLPCDIAHLPQVREEVMCRPFALRYRQVQMVTKINCSVYS